MSTHPIIAEDVAAVLGRTQSLWPDLKNATVFITGATGFFGIWLLETLLAANREFSLGCRIVGLSRDPNGFTRKAAHLATNPAISWLSGDVRRFTFPTGPITHVIHAATESSTNLNVRNPQKMFNVCVQGTRRVLSLAQEKRARRMLFTSSGAVYGRQPKELISIPEDYTGGPDPLNPQNAYAEGKRAAEFLCALAAADEIAGVPVSVARCFAFVGPHLPLDKHFAIGNFIRDALAGGPIRVHGNGAAFRSYLYAADLTEWLTTILLRGTPGRAYNVGGQEPISIHQLAHLVAKTVATAAPPPVNLMQLAIAPKPAARPPQPDAYVPSCLRALHELGLIARTPLDIAITRTARWYLPSYDQTG